MTRDLSDEEREEYRLEAREEAARRRRGNRRAFSPWDELATPDDFIEEDEEEE